MPSFMMSGSFRERPEAVLISPDKLEPDDFTLEDLMNMAETHESNVNVHQNPSLFLNANSASRDRLYSSRSIASKIPEYLPSKSHRLEDAEPPKAKLSKFRSFFEVKKYDSLLSIPLLPDFNLSASNPMEMSVDGRR